MQEGHVAKVIEWPDDWKRIVDVSEKLKDAEDRVDGARAAYQRESTDENKRTWASTLQEQQKAWDVYWKVTGDYVERL